MFNNINNNDINNKKVVMEVVTAWNLYFEN